MIRPSLAAMLFIASAAIAADKPEPSYPPLPKAKYSSFGATELDGFILPFTACTCQGKPTPIPAKQPCARSTGCL